MGIQSGHQELPGRPEAIATIHQFTEIDPSTVADHLRLAEALGGMSAALSAVALDYGETHRVSGIKMNIGLWTNTGSDTDAQPFVVLPQGIGDRPGASLSHGTGAKEDGAFFKHATVPSTEILERFQRESPYSRRVRNMNTPYWDEVYAEYITRSGGVRGYEMYWPFHLPVSDRWPDDPRRDAMQYMRILQDLSRTLLQIVA